MISRITRRQALATPLALTSCGKREPYFGKSTPPPSQTLVYENGGEPSGLDPATCLGNSEEGRVMPALIEGLLSLDPHTLEARAGLATHYKVDANLTEFTFFLRGHPTPAGTKLSGAANTHDPALWSDGRPVTADDFVYAWRRLVDPANTGTYASSLYPIDNAKEISEGKARPETLAASAEGEFTLRISLKAPAAHFLKVVGMTITGAVPRHAIQQHGSSWTKAGRMPSCGPFRLHEWKPYDRIILRKNPYYFDAARVRLDEIVVLPVTDGATGVNLYKTGSVSAMHGRAIPPLWIPALRRRKDFRSTPACRSLFYAFNTTKPPFDNPLVRYAFHMAVDKHEITRFLAGGQTPTRTIVPPFDGYEGISRLPIEVGGRLWDVLSYDPESARALMKIAGADRLVFELTFPNRTRSKEMAQILQNQWRVNLDAEVDLAMMDASVWGQTMMSMNYRGVIESGGGADYPDPNSFFELFTGRTDGSGWNDPEFDRMVDRANAQAETAEHMRRLAACEERLLRTMPVLPLFFDSYSYLQKPYVSGMPPNVLDTPQFKNVWIDTSWRP